MVLSFMALPTPDFRGAFLETGGLEAAFFGFAFCVAVF